MPDPIAQMSAEEQSYFDSRGEVEVQQSPAVETVEVAQEPIKQVQPKVTKKSGKLPTQEISQEQSEPLAVVKTQEQIELESVKIALKQSREEKKDFERVTNERLRLLQTAFEQRSAPQPAIQEQEAIPDVDKDPLGTLKYLLKEAQNGRQQQQLTVQQQEAQNYNQRIQGEAMRLEREFLVQQDDYDATSGMSPTYNDASTFLVNARKAELNATGAYNPMQINQILVQETLGLAQQALQNGRNPAQIVMEVAKARGYKPVPKAPIETEQERITRIGKGQEAGFSLSQATGSRAPANKELNAKTLATMSDDDFTAFMAKAKKSELRQVFGD